MVDSLEGLRARVGAEWPAGVYPIERGMVRRFARAIGDTSARWQDEAPPTFIVTLGFEQVEEALATASPATLLHGSTELECYRPVVVGDTVTVTAKITGIRERQGQMGKTAFITFELAYFSQRQELVARCRQMIISY